MHADLKRAAEILEREAASLRECHTMGGFWYVADPADRAAKADHDEMQELARKLRRAATGESNDR